MVSCSRLAVLEHQSSLWSVCTTFAGCTASVSHPAYVAYVLQITMPPVVVPKTRHSRFTSMASRAVDPPMHLDDDLEHPTLDPLKLPRTVSSRLVRAHTCQPLIPQSSHFHTGLWRLLLPRATKHQPIQQPCNLRSALAPTHNMAEGTCDGWCCDQPSQVHAIQQVLRLHLHPHCSNDACRQSLF